MIGLACLILVDALYVSPSGNDRAVGSEARPLKTIARALAKARESGAKRIVVAAGEYPQEASLDTQGLDGLVLEAKRGTRPLIVGAVVVPTRAITLCPDEDLQRRAATLDKDARVYEIDLAKVPGAKLSPYTPYGFPRPIIAGPTELFADAEPMRIARWPNEGFTTIASVREPGNGESDRNQPPRRPVFTAATDRAKGWTSGTTWLYGYWKYDWADETIQIHAIDPATGEITLETPHTYGVEKGAEFFAENVPEELDAVGEYVVDIPHHSVRFVARTSQRVTYRLSVLGEPLVRAGSGVTFRDLDFAYSRGDGASLWDAKGTTFEGCRFFNLGQRGVVVQGGSKSGLIGCDVWNTAEGGVVLAGGDRQTLQAARNFVTNCDIHHYQRRSMTYRPAVLMSGVGNEVTHCDLHDAPHSAIIFSGNDHLIAGNHFFRTIGRTGDGGVVYTGRDWTARGTRIEDNDFSDNVGISKWEPAIYFDDQASGLIARNNVIRRCHWGFLIGGGRDNLIEGNLIVDCKLGMHCDARGLGWAARSRPTMEERLAAVPYRSDVWRSRYPTLAKILDEDPMAPFANVIRGNQLVRSGKLMQDTEAPFAKTAAYEANVETTNIDPAEIARRVALMGIRRDGRRPKAVRMDSGPRVRR